MDAGHYLLIARQLSDNDCYQKSFNLYLWTFDKYPNAKRNAEMEFRENLVKLNNGLAAMNNHAEMFNNFERAVHAYPGNVEILYEIGKHLFRLGYMSQALSHFEKVLAIDSSHGSVEKYANKTKGSLFQRSHFRALNDRVRNEAYRKAIQSVVKQHDRVLDLDTGVGVLALYASSCSPRTAGSECARPLYELAEHIMRDNAANVLLMNKSARGVTESNMAGRASVVLTDLISSGLFANNILQNLTYAWEDLLQPNGKVIPLKAEYFVAAANCDDIKLKYQLEGWIKQVLNITYRVHCSTFASETYNSEDVYLYDNIKYLGEPQSLFKINFNDPSDIENKLNTRERLNVVFGGSSREQEINVVIGWFNLYLTEDIILTNDPRSQSKVESWPQAVFFDFIPRTIAPDECVHIQFLTYHGILKCLPNTMDRIVRISSEMLCFLNDKEYTKLIVESIGCVSIYVGQMEDMALVDVADLNPFPLLGFLMMKRGARSLLCCAKTDLDKAFIETVFQANGIPLSKLDILYEDSWSNAVFEDRKFYVVFANVLDMSGYINTQKMAMARQLKQSFMVNGGLFLPENILVMGQLVKSEWLDIINKVYDENIGEFSVARHVNRFETTDVTHVDLQRLERCPLSHAAVVADCCYQMRNSFVKLTVTADGECNAILCWYKIHLMRSSKPLYTNKTTSHIKSMAFLPKPPVRLHNGDNALIINNVDIDGNFKLMLDLEP